MRTTYPFFTTHLHSDLWRQMDRVFEDVATEFSPAYEVDERDDHYAISVDLPGIKKDEIKIEVLDKALTVSGERKKFDKPYGTFKRSFVLPGTVSTDKIEAQYEDGVLMLYVPKTPAAQSRTIEVQPGTSSFLQKFLSPKTAQDSTQATQAN
jgi:HSP20 family protein